MKPFFIGEWKVESVFHLLSPDIIPASEMKGKNGGTLADYHYEFFEDGTYRVFCTQTSDADSECGTWFEKNNEYCYDNPSLASFPNTDFARLYKENGSFSVGSFGMKLYLKKV